MGEHFFVSGNNKTEKYESLLLQLNNLFSGENDFIANISNCTSLIKYGFNFFWVGFYLVKDNELVLGPFQGTVACSRIKKGKGVCGKAWENENTIIVDDVDAFPGHIACSSASKSEIVVPIFNKKRQIIGVLDIDDDNYATFDATDKMYLEKVTLLLGQLFVT